MEFKEEIRPNFRSLQQYLSLAAFCAGDSPSRRAARFDSMNAVGGITLVRLRASGCPLRAQCLALQSWVCRHRDSVAGSRHWRQYGHLQSDQCRYSKDAAGEPSRTARRTRHENRRRPLVYESNWEQVRDRQDVFSGAFAYSPNRFNLAVGGEVRNANTSWVSGDFFRTLGVNPLLGRTIAEADDKRGCPVIGLLSYDFWQREYGGTADVFDRRLTLDSHPVRIVGVAPPGFTGIQVGEAVDIYMPLCAEGTLVREKLRTRQAG
jgi:hypothetical protein